jgi:hypothetical protein
MSTIDVRDEEKKRLLALRRETPTSRWRYESIASVVKRVLDEREEKK